MVKISIRELLEQEQISHDSLIEEMRENGQVNVHVDELDEFIRSAVNFGVSFKVSTIINNEVCIYAA